MITLTRDAQKITAENDGVQRQREHVYSTTMAEDQVYTPRTDAPLCSHPMCTGKHAKEACWWFHPEQIRNPSLRARQEEKIRAYDEGVRAIAEVKLLKTVRRNDAAQIHYCNDEDDEELMY